MKLVVGTFTFKLAENIEIIKEPTFITAMMIPQGKLVVNKNGNEIVITPPVMLGQSEWCIAKSRDDINMFATLQDVKDLLEIN